MRFNKHYIWVFLIGLLLGGAIVHILPDFTKNTQVYVTKEQLNLDNNIVIPEGTNLIKTGIGVGAGPYGEFVLCINMDTAQVNKMQYNQMKGDWFLPYWVLPVSGVESKVKAIK